MKHLVLLIGWVGALHTSLYPAEKHWSGSGKLFYQLSKPTTDSIIVKGYFTWTNPKIEGYPAYVKIVHSNNPDEELLQKVDSNGFFEQKLAYGNYQFSPQLNYHWMGEELIRINDKRATLSLEVNADLNKKVAIRLDTIAWPNAPLRTAILENDDIIDPKEIDQFMSERMAFFEIPGATLSLIKNNEIIYHQIYGVTNANTRLPVTQETLFEAGSVTKLVFAFAVMRLYERGEIDLDLPLHQYLKHEQINDDRYLSMTARHVLSHQSGMANWPKKDENGQFKLKFTPGTQYGYSGKAFEYLKEVVESLTSKSIESILNEEVLVPLNIKGMHFKGNETIAQLGANGHKKYIPSDIFLAKRTMVAYSLQTTSTALADFAIALRQRKGLKESTYKEFLKVHSQRDDGTQWGLGVRIENTSSGISYGHSGSTGRGFISNLVFYDDSGLGYVVLTNSQMGGWLSLPLLNEFLVLGSDSGK